MPLGSVLVSYKFVSTSSRLIAKIQVRSLVLPDWTSPPRPSAPPPSTSPQVLPVDPDNTPSRQTSRGPTCQPFESTPTRSVTGGKNDRSAADRQEVTRRGRRQVRGEEGDERRGARDRGGTESTPVTKPRRPCHYSVTLQGGEGGRVVSGATEVRVRTRDAPDVLSGTCDSDRSSRR